ncbi:hypothetical protein [Sedimenticola selenatireducens]|uniref:Uncharacterized protein n=1 Tax=Sedimenticola selenatireducens TaxID=191960 RepID=A0A558E104_9GAMM|nr:hypothetical protein [Sedimenticola selenatireducens]TVO75101.1 hypothetical protein FHP88_08800 [Sedimenticola selenatireducens]TVT67045.1 MAG: hypothetical protein FHK78_01560 [Sedimenticola selenatireducens]
MGRFHVTEHNAWEARTAFLDKLKWYTWSGWISTIHKIKIPDAAKYTPRNDMLVTLRERIRSL